MANEPIIYDENTDGKVTKITNSEEGMKIEQYHPDRGMCIIGFDPAETKRLIQDVQAAVIIESSKELMPSESNTNISCWHNSVSYVNGKPHCHDCGGTFQNGELAKIYREREKACSHPNLEHGYASNPPKAWCPDCRNYIRC